MCFYDDAGDDDADDDNDDDDDDDDDHDDDHDDDNLHRGLWLLGNRETGKSVLATLLIIIMMTVTMMM